ncbi:MAG: UDP-glucose 4-epimerase GalE [Acidobacteriota bacterium]|nr:UDP-glucose 4-epimerase GalE [Acidobacteriota bacterium]
MNILVTGGAGYVGSVCAGQLLKQKHRVVVYDDLSAGHRGAVPAGAIFVKGEIGNAGLLLRTFKKHKTEAVMHFAAKALVDESVRNPSVFYRNNVSATLTLLDALLECRITKLIFSSSAAVYGEPQTIPIPEDHPKAPVNPYGETKLVIEGVLWWYARAYGLQFAAMRYFNAAGATKSLGEDHRPETHLLPRLLDAALDPSKEFFLYGTDYPTPDGTCLRDFVHVLDIAEAHILALRRLNQIKSAVYNVGLGEGYSIRQAARAVEEVTGKKIKVNEAPRRPGDPAKLVASSAKLSRDLGWAPRHSDLTNIVRTAWRWRQKHPAGYAK